MNRSRSACGNLIQLPHGGDLLIPTYSKVKPRILFGEIPAHALICEDHLVRFRMCLTGEQKIAVPGGGCDRSSRLPPLIR